MFIVRFGMASLLLIREVNQEWSQYSWWTQMDKVLVALNGPKWTILVHLGLVNGEIQFGIR